MLANARRCMLVVINHLFMTPFYVQNPGVCLATPDNAWAWMHAGFDKENVYLLVLLAV